MFSPRGKKSQDTAESNTSIPEFLGKLCLCEFLEAMDTPGCSSSLQTLAPLTGAFISIHLLEWFGVSGHSLLERSWSALFYFLKKNHYLGVKPELKPWAGLNYSWKINQESAAFLIGSGILGVRLVFIQKLHHSDFPGFS